MGLDETPKETIVHECTERLLFRHTVHKRWIWRSRCVPVDGSWGDHTALAQKDSSNLALRWH